MLSLQQCWPPNIRHTKYASDAPIALRLRSFWSVSTYFCQSIALLGPFVSERSLAPPLCCHCSSAGLPTSATPSMRLTHRLHFAYAHSGQYQPTSANRLHYSGLFLRALTCTSTVLSLQQCWPPNIRHTKYASDAPIALRLRSFWSVSTYFCQSIALLGPFVSERSLAQDMDLCSSAGGCRGESSSEIACKWPRR